MSSSAEYQSLGCSKDQFGFSYILLLKEQTLGSGSYGGVCKAKCDGLLCAAKIMHPTLFDVHDTGAVTYLWKFEQECHLLSSARHPNVVQYLGTYCDPDTRLPVLLMELCDESLSSFLSRSPEPLAYHLQINISHDIALAIAYLHLNSLSHRDLTSNNVLLIAGAWAKITDFRMSKLIPARSHCSPLTLCPGNMQYMSPESLEEPPFYTDKLDVFSLGVLMVQIVTRLFPDPGPQYQTVHLPDYPEDSVKYKVREVQWRSSHLVQIPETNSLKVMALRCLRDKEKERPSAQELSERLWDLKQSTQYVSSLQSLSQTSGHDGMGKDIRDGTLRVVVNKGEKNGKEGEEEVVVEMREMEEEVKEVEVKEEEEKKVNDSSKEDMVSKLRVELDKKDKEILHLRTENEKLRSQVEIAATTQEQQVSVREIQIPKEVGIPGTRQPNNNKQVTNEPLKRNRAHTNPSVSSIQDATTSLKLLTPTFSTTATPPTPPPRVVWRKERNYPEAIVRGSIVTQGDTVFINPHNSKKIYVCKLFSDGPQWSKLPDNIWYDASLVVIDHILVSTGGEGMFQCTNSLRSLTKKSLGKKKEFPGMPTARCDVSAVTTENWLIVAGGYNGSRYPSTIEIMELSSVEWATAGNLPGCYGEMFPIVCGGVLYLGGGYNECGDPIHTMLACSLSDLLSPRKRE